MHNIANEALGESNCSMRLNNIAKKCLKSKIIIIIIVIKIIIVITDTKTNTN